MQRNGSATSLKLDTSPRAMLTSAASLTCERPTSPATHSVISSPASAAGRMLSDSPDGMTADLFGQVPVPANRSRGQVKAPASAIRGISGQTGLRSFASASLQSFLENRLRGRLPGCGLTLFTLTWKPQVTPSGREYFLLRASAPRKDGTELGSWQTPTTRDGKGESGKGNRTKRGKPGKPHVANLCDQLVDLGRRDLVRSSAFRCHLMGYPTCWEDAAPTATRSCRKSQPSSSAP